jgi:hypothetical protein
LVAGHFHLGRFIWRLPNIQYVLPDVDHVRLGRFLPPLLDVDLGRRLASVADQQLNPLERRAGRSHVLGGLDLEIPEIERSHCWFALHVARLVGGDN